jgi:hypothetical protein
MIALRYSLLFIGIHVLWFIATVLINLVFNANFGGMVGHIGGVVISSILVVYFFETRNKRVFRLNEMVLLLLYTNIFLFICNMIDLLFISQENTKKPISVLMMLSLIQISLTLFVIVVYRGKPLKDRTGEK